MADQRLELLMKKTEPQFVSGSPILLEANALYLDRGTNNCIAQLKWKNLDSRPIKAVMIELDGYDAFNQKLESIHYQYDALLVTQGSEFGGKTPIVIKNNKVVKYDVLLKAVSFSDETIWRAEKDVVFEMLPAAKDQKLKGDILDQLKRDLSKQGNRNAASYSPQQALGLWQCGCGSWQYADTPCLKCKMTQKALENASDESVLAEHLTAYLEEQERLRIEAEKKAEEDRIAREKAQAEEEKRREEERIRREQERLEAEKRALAAKKKMTKIIEILAACVVVAIGIGCAIKFYFIPQGQYNKAIKLMKEEKYKEASAQFQALGDYSDSKYRVNQVAANYYYANGLYDNVGDIYATLPEKYQDHAADFKSQYNDAVTQMEAGQYDEAIASFTKLGNYSNSKDMITEATYRKAAHLADQGLYDDAINIYTSLGEYSDSANLLAQTKADKLFAAGAYSAALKIYSTLDEKYHTNAENYKKLYADALTLQSEGKYDEAMNAFTAIADYSDSLTQILQSKYLKASALASAGNYDDAVTLFDSLDEYSDSKSLSKKASADKLYDSKDYSGAYSIYSTLDESYQTHAADYTAMYDSAKALLDGGNFDGAASAFAALGSYRDSSVQIQECSYRKAASLTAQGEYDAAITIYNSLNDYSDSRSLSAQANADKLYSAGKFADAYQIYATLDEKYQTHESDYQKKYSDAKALQTAAKYDPAVAAFTALGDYSDSVEQIKQTKYLKAGSLADSGKFDDAIALYDELGEYSDSKSLALKTSADKLFASGDVSSAYDIYATLGDAYQTHATDYAAAYQTAESARAAGDYDNAYDQFIALGNYSNAKEKAVQCGKDKANGLFAAEKYGEAASVFSFIGDTDKAKLSTYKYAVQLASDGQFIQAANQFTSIIDYDDSREQRYQVGLKAYEAGQLADAYEILATDIDYSNAKETVYQIGVSASAVQQYDVSVKAFTAVGAYKDSAMNLTMDTYAYGEQLHDAGLYDEAAAVFAGMNGFSNTAEKAQMSAYAAAARELENGNYEDAIARFTALGNYSDSQIRVKNAQLRWAESFFTAGDFETAKKMFEDLKQYSNSAERLKATKYAIAQKHYDAAEYEDAVSGFHEISGYNDADERELASRYALYSTYYNAGMYDKAITGFELIASSNYSDSATQAKKSHYAKAQALDASDPLAAYDEYVLAEDYSDAKQQVKTHAYEIGISLQESNAYTEAVNWYEIAADYSDAKEHLYKIGLFYFSTQDYETSLNALKTLRDYKDSSDYLLRIGNYFDMQSEVSNAYLAYGYASHPGENVDKIDELKQTLSKNAANYFSNGKLEEASSTYETLAKVDPTFGKDLNEVDFLLFLKDCKIVTIGSTNWKYLSCEDGQLIFISNSALTKAPYRSATKTTVKQWLSSAIIEYFNSQERKLVTLWVLSSSEVKKYMKNNTDRKTNGADYIWCSDTDASYWSTVYKYYNAKTGEMPIYFNSSTGGEYQENGVRPGLKMTYNTEVYHMLTSDPSRYSYVSINGKNMTFEPRFKESSIESANQAGNQQPVETDNGSKEQKTDSAPSSSGKQTNKTGNQPSSGADKDPKEPKKESVDNSTVSEDATKLVDGWYISDDGKYAIKPSNLRKLYSGYSVSIQIRKESTQAIILNTSVTLDPEDSTIKNLVKDKAIREFKYEGNREYSFCIAVIIENPDLVGTGITMLQYYSFNVN